MLRSIHTTALTFLIGASLLIACGKTESKEPNVVVAQTFFDVPICNWLRHGIVYYVVDSDEFFFCDGRQLLPVDLSGQDGEDGQDGTSCTVTRDDTAGTTTIRCEDGTEAVVYDGQDGEDGEDGASCVVTETAAGASITCGDDTVTITDGQDGSSCSASADASGAVTISCDDGSSATIPAGDEDGAATVELLCEVIGVSGLQEPRGLDCAPYCPCFSEAEILAAAQTDCRRTDYLDFSRTWSTLPEQTFSAGDTEFVAPPFNVFRDFGEYGCVQYPNFFRGVSISYYSHLECIRVIEDTVGPCEQIIQCENDSDCVDDDTCTVDLCGAPDTDNFRACLNGVFRPDGEACTKDGEPGQCFLGTCRPSIGGGPIGQE